MHTLEIPGARIYREFPSELSELSADQFLFFTEQFLRLMDGKITLHGFKVLLAGKFLKFKKRAKFYAMGEAVIEEINDNIARIAEEMDSFLVYEENTVTIKVAFTENLLPNIGCYYGPSDVLADCTAFEYKEAHAAFIQYVNTKKVEHLDRLMAVLYRKRKRFLPLLMLKPSFDGQVRRGFSPKSNPVLLEKRQKWMSKRPFHVKYGVFLIFQAFEEFLRSGEIDIDGNAICLAELYKGDGDGGDAGIGMMGLFFELAESRVFGTLDDVMGTNIYDIFTRIYQLVKMSDNLKIKMENDKNK
jgi:hypothetical protein